MRWTAYFAAMRRAASFSRSVASSMRLRTAAIAPRLISFDAGTLDHFGGRGHAEFDYRRKLFRRARDDFRPGI